MKYNDLSVQEKNRLSKMRCRHGHTLLEHLSCYKGFKEKKVLFFDIETTAHEGFYWGKSWETNIIETIEYGKILSFAAKWSNKKAFVRGWIDYKKYGERSLVKEIWKLFDEADVVVAHNGKSFDIKWCNTKFAQYRLPVPSPYKVIDTKTDAKKYLYLPSYSLNNIASYFGIGQKVEHEGFSLWKKCILGDRRAWRKMKQYNLQDVILLAKVNIHLDPFRNKKL